MFELAGPRLDCRRLSAASSLPHLGDAGRKEAQADGDLLVGIHAMAYSGRRLLTAVRFMVTRAPGFGSPATPIVVRAGRALPILAS